MAIYKNREVSVVSPTRPVVHPEQVTVRYQDGTHENVSLGQVRYTEDEKKALMKSYPSVFDSVQIVDDKDLEAVRVGVTPPSDPSYQEQAENQARNQKQQELLNKNTEEARKEAKTRLEKNDYKQTPKMGTTAANTPERPLTAQEKAEGKNQYGQKAR